MLEQGVYGISLLCVTPAVSFFHNRWLVRGRRGLVGDTCIITLNVLAKLRLQAR